MDNNQLPPLWVNDDVTAMIDVLDESAPLPRMIAAAPVMLAALRMHADSEVTPERAAEALHLARTLAEPVQPITHKHAREIAQDWHSVMTWSDPGVSIYAFGSSGRCRDAADYRLAVSELGKSREWLLPRLLAGEDADPSVADFADLESLILYVDTRAEGAAARIDALDDFTRGYMTAALWSSTDESDDAGGDPMDKNYGLEDIALPTFNAMVADCAAFQTAQAIDLAKYCEVTNRPMDHAGHDFWLNRCGHGTGFWDRDAGKFGDRLSDAAHVCGNVDLYIGDDSQVWQAGAETFTVGEVG